MSIKIAVSYLSESESNETCIAAMQMLQQQDNNSNNIMICNSNSNDKCNDRSGKNIKEIP